MPGTNRKAVYNETVHSRTAAIHGHVLETAEELRKHMQATVAPVRLHVN
jgi:hypothetical protein